MEKREPLFKYVDCVRVSVPDVEAGLEYYRDGLGHKLLWRLPEYAGLQMPDTKTEIVLDTHPHAPEVFIKVAAVKDAVKKIKEAGGKVIVPAYEIEVGLYAVVEDPWENRYVIMDTTKGLFVTGADGNVTGTSIQ